MEQTIRKSLKDNLIKAVSLVAVLCMVLLWAGSGHAKVSAQMDDKVFFTLKESIDLRAMDNGNLLHRVKGSGAKFGEKQKKRYCELKQNDQVAWVLNDLETGEVLSQSDNAEKLFFGASVSKLFVAAALLDKQQGSLSDAQFNQLVRMIVVSSNSAWTDLQRQVGEDGSNDSGRAAVDGFVQSMNYGDIKGFQGWMQTADGKRVHGNELNALQLSNFLYDTYHDNYQGADMLWKVMHATRTGRKKLNKYTPSDVYIGGKTGTYHGPNASPDTVQLDTIEARNHAAVVEINGKHYGLSILTNTGSDEDVAVLGGGLIREYLLDDEPVSCQVQTAEAD